jgi:hypothetical protein
MSAMLEPVFGLHHWCVAHNLCIALHCILVQDFKGFIERSGFFYVQGGFVRLRSVISAWRLLTEGSAAPIG